MPVVLECCARRAPSFYPWWKPESRQCFFAGKICIIAKKPPVGNPPKLRMLEQQHRDRRCEDAEPRSLSWCCPKSISSSFKVAGDFALIRQVHAISPILYRKTEKTRKAIMVLTNKILFVVFCAIAAFSGAPASCWKGINNYSSKRSCWCPPNPQSTTLAVGCASSGNIMVDIPTNRSHSPCEKLAKRYPCITAI